MKNAEGISPARHEIEHQLERMLAHPMFQAQEMRAKIFKYLVENALSGAKVDELGLFREFYSVEEWKKHSTKVRTTVSHIRTELLAKYYADDGKDDPVIITLPAPERSITAQKKYKIVRRPPGEAYAPEFRYNPRSQVARQFAVANYLLRGGPSQVGVSLWRLAEIFSVEPRHPDVLLGFAEAIGSQLLLGIYNEAEKGKVIAEALELTQNLDPTTADEWRVRAVRALLHTCAGDLETARKEFDGALEIDRQSTMSRGWYVYFLFATGRQDEALRMFALVAEEQAENPQVQALHGIFLCKAGHYEQAEQALSQALALDRNCWPAHYGMTQMYLVTGNEAKALEQSKRLKALLEPSEYEDIMRRLNLKPRAKER